MQLLGATLSIGRPSGFVDPGKAAAAATVAADALARFQVGRGGWVEGVLCMACVVGQLAAELASWADLSRVAWPWPSVRGE